MLEQLSQKQKDAMPGYVDRWIKIGLTCMDKNEKLYKEQEKVVEPIIKTIFSQADMCPNPAIIWAESPIDITRKYILLEKFEKEQGGDWTQEQLDELPAKIRAAESTKSKRKKALLPKKERQSIAEQVLQNLVYGNQQTVKAFYEYFVLETDIPITEKINAFIALAPVAHWWLPLEKAAIISRFPLCIHRNDQGDLHSYDKPAIEYPDGFCICSFNGNRVPEWMSRTKVDDVTAEMYAKIQNVDIRAQFIKKFGYEKIEGFGKLIDSQERFNYRLLDFADQMDGVGSRARFLFMDNPSVPNLRHGEAVDNNCDSVEEALKWRRRGLPEPDVLT